MADRTAQGRSPLSGFLKCILCRRLNLILFSSSALRSKVDQCGEFGNEHSAATGSSVEPASVELSVVMPCLNEAETISKCIRKAQTVFASFFLSVLGLRRR